MAFRDQWLRHYRLDADAERRALERHRARDLDFMIAAEPDKTIIYCHQEPCLSREAISPSI